MMAARPPLARSRIPPATQANQVKVNSAYEPSGPDRARAYPGFFTEHKATRSTSTAPWMGC